MNFGLSVFAFVRYAVVVLWDYNQNGMTETFWSTRILAWTVWPVGLLLQGATIWKKLPAAGERRACEAHNIHACALLIVRSALARLESRGAHYRTDYPLHDDAHFQKHSVVRGGKVSFE